MYKYELLSLGVPTTMWLLLMLLFRRHGVDIRGLAGDGRRRELRRHNRCNASKRSG